MLLRTQKQIVVMVAILSVVGIANVACAQQSNWGGTRYHTLPGNNARRPSAPASRTNVPYQNAWQNPNRRTVEQVHRPLGGPAAGAPIIRGQQPGYGGQSTYPLPSEGVYQQRNSPFPPPATVAYPGAAGSPYSNGAVPTAVGQPPYQPRSYGAPTTPRPAGSGLNPVWNGQSWAQPLVQPVVQPPFVPQSPYVIPDEYADLNVLLAEARTGRLVIGAGVNSDAGLVGNLVIDEQNFDLWRWPASFQEFRNGTAFRGGGQRLRLELMPGTVVQRYSFNFSEPYLFQTAVSFGLSGFYYDRAYTDWDEKRRGGRISLGYVFPQRPDLSTTFTTRFENIRITDPSVVGLKDLDEVLGNNDLLGLRWQVAHDTRDSTVLPTEGHLIQLSFEQVVGTFDYPKFVGDFRKYYVISERPDRSGRHVLGLAGRIGVSGKNTPIYDRFFAGGFSTIRGFDFRGASPVSGTGVVVGGEFQMLGSAEYRFPLTASDQVFGSLFLDVGTVEEVASVTASDIRITPGFELRVNIPQLGPIPIAVGMGFPIQYEEGDDIRNFHFFVGISR